MHRRPVGTSVKVSASENACAGILEPPWKRLGAAEIVPR